MFIQAIITPYPGKHNSKFFSYSLFFFAKHSTNADTHKRMHTHPPSITIILYRVCMANYNIKRDKLRLVLSKSNIRTIEE